MSARGLRIAADAFSALQKAKELLIREGCNRVSALSGKQDIMLGQLMQKGIDAMKEEFNNLTMMGVEAKTAQPSPRRARGDGV